MRGKAKVRVTLPIPPAQVYPLWADMDNHVAWTRDLKQVDGRGPGRYRWVMHGPLGRLAWDAEVTIDRPSEGFAWCVRGPHTSGYTRVSWRARPDQCTELTVQRYVAFRDDAPGAFRTWWGDPEARLHTDVTHFTQHLQRRATAGRLARVVHDVLPMASETSPAP